MRMRSRERGRVKWCEDIRTLHGGAYLKRKMVYLYNESFSLTFIILEHSAIGFITRDLNDILILQKSMIYILIYSIIIHHYNVCRLHNPVN